MRLRELVEELDARFIILSFSDDGFIAPAALRDMLAAVGRVSEQRQAHATYRGCRNLSGRSPR